MRIVIFYYPILFFLYIKNNMKNKILKLKGAVCGLALIFILVGVESCRKETEFGVTRASGIVQKQGTTTYQYGTHVLLAVGTTETLYALRSDRVNLDDYINKEVELKGHLVKDYPVDGGPEFLEVVKVISEK